MKCLFSLLLAPSTPMLWDLFRTTLNFQGSMIPKTISFLQLSKLFIFPPDNASAYPKQPEISEGITLWAPELYFTLKCKSSPCQTGLGEWIYQIISIGKVGVVEVGGDEQKSTWQGREEQGEEEVLAKNNKSRKGSWDHWWQICQVLGFPKG